jgi:phage gp46-like protein
MDFATVLSPELVFDWALAGGDLASDEGLYTAVAIALFSDRLANPDDMIPDGTADRRGWGGDAYLPPLASGTPDHIGSRLWLLSRAKAIPETALLAQAYCEEALQWLLDDGVAAAVTVPLPSFSGPSMMEIVITIAQQQGAVTANRRFAFQWNMTTGSVSGVALPWA